MFTMVSCISEIHRKFLHNDHNNIQACRRRGERLSMIARLIKKARLPTSHVDSYQFKVSNRLLHMMPLVFVCVICILIFLSHFLWLPEAVLCEGGI